MSSKLQRRGKTASLCVLHSVATRDDDSMLTAFFGSALKTKTGSLPSCHTTKENSHSLNLNWTCARGVRECDRCIETEIK